MDRLFADETILERKDIVDHQASRWVNRGSSQIRAHQTYAFRFHSQSITMWATWYIALIATPNRNYNTPNLI